MVVFVLVRIHELVDVFAGPGVLVLARGCDGFRRPCLPLVAEPCVEPWDVAAADLAVVDGVLVAAERGLESGQFDWVSGDFDGYEVTIPGTAGSARGTFVDMGNPHVVAVIEDAFSSLPTVEQLDLVTKPVVSPQIESDQNVEFVRIDEQSEGDNEGSATMRVNERGCGETLSCGTGLCATAITLRAKTGIDHWTITVRGGTLRVDVTDDDVKLTGSATIVGKIELL